MKKPLFLAFAAAAIFSMSFTSCKKDKDETPVAAPLDCTAEYQKISDAAKKYVSDPSKENCKSYRSAIEAYKKTSCLTDAQKTSLDAAIKALTCQ